MSTTTSPIVESEPLVLHFSPVLKKMSEEEFYEFCRLNPDLSLELNSEGDLIIMPPTGVKSGARNAILGARLTTWAVENRSGKAFDSSTLFTLPSGAKRSPDFAWVGNERWNALTEEEQEQFPPLCPDFVVELRSRTDRLANLQRKMDEYMANGAQLGWLIDPLERKVHVYRPSAPVEELDSSQTISGEPLLRGLSLNLEEIWN